MDEIATCLTCGCSVSLDDAVDGGWVPYFWDETLPMPVEVTGPWCCSCSKSLGIENDPETMEWVRRAPAGDEVGE